MGHLPTTGRMFTDPSPASSRTVGNVFPSFVAKPSSRMRRSASKEDISPSDIFLFPMMPLTFSTQDAFSPMLFSQR